MFVIWRRPDGFQGARPEDFKVVELRSKSFLWLHKNERHWFPFQVSGGWQDEDQTKRINGLVNLIGKSPQQWLDYLVGYYHDAIAEDDPSAFLEELDTWLNSILNNLKGDKWEQDIIEQAVSEVIANVEQVKNDFLGSVSN